MPSEKPRAVVLLSAEEEARLKGLLAKLQALPKRHPLRLSPRATLPTLVHWLATRAAAEVEEALSKLDV